MNYYNEFEPYAAQWLENLAQAGHIGAGRVDIRSIKEVKAEDVIDARRAHFFAGIGVWEHALRLAGWPAEQPVWTGSCPCQPFSVAGRGLGVDDPRHLWPVWFELIKKCRPPVVFGEQVASPDGLAWLDAVRADLEGAGYAFGAADLCAAGVGAPHIRQRLYFVGVRQDGLAHHHQQGRGQFGGVIPKDGHAQPRPDTDGRCAARGLADDGREGRRQVGEDVRGGSEGSRAQGLEQRPLYGGALDARGVGHADSEHAGRDAGASHRTEGGPRLRGGGDEPRAPGAVGQRMAEPNGVGRGETGLLARSRAVASGTPGPEHRPGHAGPTGGFWSNPDWVACRDGKLRPVEPGSFPLAHGAPARVGRLRAYGNAIVSEVASTFIRAVMEALENK